MSPEGNDSLTGPPAFPSWPKRLLLAARALSPGSAGPEWLLTLVDQGLVSATTFLAGIIIGRTCGKEQFGLYLLGVSIIGLIMELQNVVIWSPYTVLSHRLTGSAQALYAGSTLIHQLGFSVLGMLALAVTGFCLSWGIGLQELGAIVKMLAVVGGFLFFREYARRICFAGLKMKAALALDSGAMVVQLGGLLWLAYLGKLSAFRAFGVMGLGCALAGLSWFIWARKGLGFSFTQAVSDLGRNWSFGKWILGGNMSEYVALQLLYPWFLAALQGTAAVGMLAACQAVVALANPFLQGSRNFLGPKAAQAFAQGGVGELRKFVVKSTLLLAPVIGLFYAAIIIFGNNLVIFFYGSQYGGQSIFIAILALNAFIYALPLVVDCGIWAMGRPDLNLMIDSAILVVSLTLGFWLVNTFGLLGVGLGLLASTLMAFVVRGLILTRLSHSHTGPTI